jgi:hypothetical protein
MASIDADIQGLDGVFKACESISPATLTQWEAFTAQWDEEKTAAAIELDLGQGLLTGSISLTAGDVIDDLNVWAGRVSAWGQLAQSACGSQATTTPTITPPVPWGAFAAAAGLVAISLAAVYGFYVVDKHV